MDDSPARLGAGAKQPGRRGRLLRRRGSRAASDRWRQARGRAHHVFQRAARRQRRLGRGLREEIRHQGQSLSGELGGDPPARADRSRRQAVRRGFHPQQRPRDGSPGGREAAAGGEVALCRRCDAGRDPAAPPMGRFLSQRPGCGLQYRPGQEGRAAEELFRSDGSPLEGQDRHRGRRFRLVCRPDGRARRGGGRQAVSPDRRQQRVLGPQGPYAPDQPGRGRRGAAGADGLQLHGRAAEEARARRSTGS